MFCLFYFILFIEEKEGGVNLSSCELEEQQGHIIPDQPKSQTNAVQGDQGKNKHPEVKEKYKKF